MRPHFKLGVFASNCAGGMTITTVPERWDASWKSNVALAKMLDAAGMDFMLPIARWIGYGGETDFQGHSLETMTWAAGLLAVTQRLHVIATMQTAVVSPVVVAKQMATIADIGGGRAGLNIVAGWNEPEYRALGLALPAAHAERYDYAQEWFDVIAALWSREALFDWTSHHFRFEGVYARPRPETRPLIVNAAGSGEGRAFAVRNSDYLFTPTIDIVRARAEVATLRAMAADVGRSVQVLTLCHVVCRPTEREAEAYAAHVMGRHTDVPALERLIDLQFAFARSSPPEMLAMLRDRIALGHGGYPLIGTPESITAQLVALRDAGFDGTTLSFVNYLDEFPYFAETVLPRLEQAGLRSSI